MVEAGGVEPPSENHFTKPSPGAGDCLKFPYNTHKRQSILLSSSEVMTVAGADNRSRSLLK